MGKTKLTIKTTKWFWGYWLIAAAIITLGVFLMPIWKDVNVFWRNWSNRGMSMVMVVLLGIYAGYLISRIKKNDPLIKISIHIAEVVVLLVVALLCFLQQFEVLDIMGPSLVIGMAVWLRGVVMVLNAYLFEKRVEDKISVWLIIGLICVTMGTVGMVYRFTTTPIFMWVVSVALVLLGICAIVLGIISIPKKPRTASDADEKKEKSDSKKA